MKNLLFLALLIPAIGSAVQLDVTVTNCPGGLTTAQCESLADEIRNYDEIPDVDLDTYAEGISDSTAFASKGQGSDYSDNFSLFAVSVSGGAAVKGDVDEMGDNPEAAEGFGVAASLRVGLNLDLLPIDKIGPVEFKNLDVFASFFSYSLDQDMDETSIKGDISSMGIYARYKLIEPVSIVPGYLVEWGGLHLHTGFSMNKMKIDVAQDLESQTVEDGSLSATFDNGYANFAIDSSASFIPVELSTYVRLGYVFTFFAGAGFDYNISETDVDILADGEVSGTGTASGFTADVSANDSAAGEGMATNFRAFGGLQFNIPFVRVYAQVNKALGEDLIGASAGVKVAF